MNFIGKLPNFNSLTVPQEQQTEVTAQQPAKQPATSNGIANTNDGFEAANPMKANFFGLAGEQTEILVSNQLVIAPDPTVNASMLFDYVIDVQQQAPEPTDPMSRKEFRPDPIAEDHEKELAELAKEIEARRIDKEKIKEAAMQKYERYKEQFEREMDPGLSGDILNIAFDAIGEISAVGGDIANTVFDGMGEIGLGDVADWLHNTGGDVLGVAGNVVGSAAYAVTRAEKALGKAAEDAGEWTVEAAEDIAEAAAKAAAKAAEDAAAAAAEAAEAAINEVGEVLEDVGDAVGDVADDVGEFLGDFW